MKKIINFFKTSPLSWWKIVVLTILTAIFVLGGIYLSITNPKDCGFVFTILGILFGFFSIWGINCPIMEKWTGINKPWREDYSWFNQNKD